MWYNSFTVKEAAGLFKKILSAVTALTMIMGMCSCSGQTSSGDISSSAYSHVDIDKSLQLTANYDFKGTEGEGQYDKGFVGAVNGFSVELFKNSVKDDLSKGKNTLVSPESVAFALGMAQNGADGNTLKQMQDVLYKGVSLETFNKNMNFIMTEIKAQNDKNAKVKIANSVWVKDRNDIVPKEQFLRDCKELYNADLFKGAFDDKTLGQVNSWVSDKTDGMIPSVIDSFKSNDLMYLINCVAFDSKWKKQYEEDQVIEDQKFTNAKDDEVKCTMLTGTEKCYLSNERAIGFTKDYAGGRYEFMAVLPNEDISVSDFVSTMTADEFSKLYKSRSYDYEVTTKLPQFTFDHELRLKDALQSMGITEAFSNDADISKMFEGNDAYIKQVFHKTHIELDAKGTKAAAATAVEAGAKADHSEPEHKEVILDRPFVFAIMDSYSTLPVFIGTVCDPSVQ